MFLAQQLNIGEVNDYDFDKGENAGKWKGLFVNSLRKVRLFYCFYLKGQIFFPERKKNTTKEFHMFLLFAFFFCIWNRFLSRYIHLYLLETTHCTMWKVYVFGCWQCFVQNHHRIRYKWVNRLDNRYVPSLSYCVWTFLMHYVRNSNDNDLLIYE